jgi:hypothetical protein
MTRISTEPGAYAMLELDDVYPPAVIENLATTYGLDPDRLAEVLEEVVADFDDKAHFYYRLPIWYNANERILKIVTHLQDALQLWSGTSERTKATVGERTLDAYSSDQLVADLEKMVTVLTEASAVAKRRNGDGTSSTKKKETKLKLESVPDFRPIYGVCQMLYDLWLEEKGERMGHEVEYGHYREVGGQEIEVGKASSPGLRFLLACLQRLDDRITAENCRTRVRAIKESEGANKAK